MCTKYTIITLVHIYMEYVDITWPNLSTSWPQVKRKTENMLPMLHLLTQNMKVLQGRVPLLPFITIGATQARFMFCVICLDHTLHAFSILYNVK